MIMKGMGMDFSLFSYDETELEVLRGTRLSTTVRWLEVEGRKSGLSSIEKCRYPLRIGIGSESVLLCARCRHFPS